MPNIPNDAKQTVADVKAVVVTTRRRLAARLVDWLRDHPHAMLAIAAAAVVLAAVFGLLRG
ncbi:MAG TPA: hypothetical protein VNF99_19675 [Stellaceae bacterium]|nr:hypothetical protein [Stellaceae bacterium]